MHAYSNDVAFYVASRRMIAEGGYEVDRSMVYYGQPAPLAAGTEDQIIRTVRELLPAGFARRGLAGLKPRPTHGALIGVGCGVDDPAFHRGPTVNWTA